jgi:NitT/TauT family transport system ATP-binding protein
LSSGRRGALVEVDDLSKVYGSGADAVAAIADLTFAIEPGELVCVVGPSGCGKTTLLKCVAGLLTATSGSVRLGGEKVERPPEGLALVFQDYSRSLLPWLSVRGNVALPLRAQRIPRAERDRLTLEALRAVGLDEFADRHPWQLSGGMQQRAAIARALAYRPGVLLMDEPFASLDAQARAGLEDLLLEVWESAGVTVLFVTHDVDEAVYLGDRILVLTPRPARIGEVVRVDLPRPRDQLTTRGSREFAEIRTHVWRLVKGEVEP